MKYIEAKQTITQEEIEELLPTIDVAVALMAYAGLRINEVMNLKIDGIDID
ncbi:hypothetical protein ACW2QC_15105 [Virgibacillus sp. FSP13]